MLLLCGKKKDLIAVRSFCSNPEAGRGVESFHFFRKNIKAKGFIIEWKHLKSNSNEEDKVIREKRIGFTKETA